VNKGELSTVDIRRNATNHISNHSAGLLSLTLTMEEPASNLDITVSQTRNLASASNSTIVTLLLYCDIILNNQLLSKILMTRSRRPAYAHVYACT